MMVVAVKQKVVLTVTILITIDLSILFVDVIMMIVVKVFQDAQMMKQLTTILTQKQMMVVVIMI